jgi:hypothetical protein
LAGVGALTALLTRRHVAVRAQVDFDGDFPIEGAKEVTTLMTRYVSRLLRLWAAAQQAAAEQVNAWAHSARARLPRQQACLS